MIPWALALGMSDIKGRELNMNEKFYLSLVLWLRASLLVLRLAKLMLEIIGTAINYYKINYVCIRAKVA